MVISNYDINFGLNDFVWLESAKFDSENFKSYYFFNPIKKIMLNSKTELNKFFDEVEFYTRKYYLAGFMSYELGYFLDENFFNMDCKTDIPYAVFGVYDSPIIFNHKTKQFQRESLEFKSKPGEYFIDDLHLNISEEKYIQNIEKIKRYIYAGDIFQVNYTLKYKFNFRGDIFNFYSFLKQYQPVGFNAFIKFDDYYILSNSPELFFNIKNNIIKAKPMKGTIGRGKNIYEDKRNSGFLQNDLKNISENTMITDLLRNDIGKISEFGSVQVADMLQVEKYKTLFQMTSVIKGELRKNLSIYEIIKSIFPSGSITGAPKLRSMEIITELEKESRQIYTGAIGFIAPNKDSCFSVAIRTALIKDGAGELGIGGGILFDSVASDEYAEAKLKAKFFNLKYNPEFFLIETILYDKNKFQYMDLHLKRLYESALYFDFKFDAEKIKSAIRDIACNFDKNKKYKIRVLLSETGSVKIEYKSVYIQENDFVIKISNIPTDSNDIFLYHKTTNRTLYNKELDIAKKNNCFDVIFYNENGYITEGAITNIYIKRENKFFTPPINDGLLNGIIRRRFMKKHRIMEKHITLQDLIGSEKVFISNSIIGVRAAKLLKSY